MRNADRSPWRLGCLAHEVQSAEGKGWWAAAVEWDAEVGVCCCCGGPSPVRMGPQREYRVMPYCTRCDEGMDFVAQGVKARGERMAA